MNYNRNHVDGVVYSLKLDDATAKALRDAHEIDVRQDLDGNITYADGSPDFSAWMRKVDANRPTLIGKGRPAPETAPAPSTLSGTMADTMRRVTAGELSVEQAVSAHMTARAASPSSGTINYTRAMIAARQGDPTALDAIMKRYL